MTEREEDRPLREDLEETGLEEARLRCVDTEDSCRRLGQCFVDTTEPKNQGHSLSFKMSIFRHDK